jgi:hypothetical protein
MSSNGNLLKLELPWWNHTPLLMLASAHKLALPEVSMQPEMPTVKNKVEARQGESGGHMRAVLTISTSLAVLVLGAIYLWFMYAHQ